MTYYKGMDDSLRTLKTRTRQALGLARAKLLTDARATVETAGPAAVIVTHLARTHGVAPLTARRWLAAAGFSLEHLSRGRPSFARLADLADVSEPADEEGQ